MLFSRKSDSDRQHLQEMLPILDELLPAMRFLADLDAVWDDLSEEERAEIEDSTVYIERDHEKLIEAGVTTLRTLSSKLKGYKLNKLRLEIQEFLDRWSEHEPDRLKVLQARIKASLGD